MYNNIKKGCIVEIDCVRAGISGLGFGNKHYTVEYPDEAINMDTILKFKEKDGINNYQIYADQVTVISQGITSRESITKRIAELEAEIANQESMLEYLEKTGLVEYDEKQYKVYKTLQLLQNKELDDIAKSVIIAEMLN